ncbi:MAG: alanine racemase, partial [Bryobacteraceae bacterium]
MSANAEAIGLPLEQLETPTLVLDLDAYRRNVHRMIETIVRKHGLAWRPHMKGQKAPELAHEALAAGAIGVTCATVYEAEAMVRAGVKGVLLANQTVGRRKLERLAELQRITPVIAATDSEAHARAMSEAAAAAGVEIPVLIELNVGMNRSGIAPGEPTVALARLIGTLPGLRLAGLMGWEGHVLAYSPEEKRERIAQSIGALVSTAEACRAAGIRIDIV